MELVYLSIILLVIFPSTSCSCTTPFITLSQLVSADASSLHGPSSLFNMTLPTHYLSVSSISFSCQTHSGCGVISSLAFSHQDSEVRIHPALLQYYLPSNWTYDARFKLYLGHSSAHYLTLSLTIESERSPITIASTLYGCEAELDTVPNRQILQYDATPQPSPPDLGYTGLLHGSLASGGVGMLTDQLTEAALTWTSVMDRNISLLFRFDREYNLTQVNIFSPDPSSILAMEIATELTDCYFTQAMGSILLSTCTGSYLFITLKSISDSLSISEVQLLTEEGQLSGKKYHINFQNSSFDKTNVYTMVFVTIIITFILTSLLCLVILASVYISSIRCRRYSRWVFRSRKFHNRKGDYVTMKSSEKSSGCSEHHLKQPENVDHDYATLKSAEQLDSSVYVDMSAVKSPAATPAPDAASSDQYVSMRIRADPSAGAGGGILSRLKGWRIRAQGRALSPDVEGAGPVNSATDRDVGGSFNLSRRGGIKLKSPIPRAPRPSAASAPQEAAAGELAGQESDENILSHEGKLKNSN